MTERIETVIIGGGQAGLAMSYHLSRLGREHVILEEKWPGHPVRMLVRERIPSPIFRGDA